MTFRPKTLLYMFSFTVFIAIILFAIGATPALAHESSLHATTNLGVSASDTKDFNIDDSRLDKKREILRERDVRRREARDIKGLRSDKKRDVLEERDVRRREMREVRDIKVRNADRVRSLTNKDGENDFVDRNSNSRREKLRAEIKEKRKEAREKLELRRSKIQEKRAGIENRLEKRRANLENKAKERIRAFIDRIGNRFEGAIERLEKISGRILSRVEKFEKKGTDMSKPRDLLEKASGDLDTAREAITLFKTEAYASIDGDNPREAFGRVHELAVVAKDSIKDARGALIDAIKAIKAQVDNPSDSKDRAKEVNTTTE